MKSWGKSMKNKSLLGAVLVGIGVCIITIILAASVMTSMVLKGNLKFNMVSGISKIVVFAAAFAGAAMIEIKKKNQLSVLIYGAAITLLQIGAGIILCEQWGGIIGNTLVVIAGTLVSLLLNKKSRKNTYSKMRSR